MRRYTWRVIPGLLFVMLLVLFWRGLSSNPHILPSAQIGKQLPYFELPNLLQDGLIHSSDLIGKPILINFWASWCAACSEEQLFLAELAEQGVTIYGINYKDQPKNAIKWLSLWSNPYRKIGVDQDGSLAIELGVYGTPETFLIAQNGVIRYRYAGVLTRQVWLNEFLPLIKGMNFA